MKAAELREKSGADLAVLLKDLEEESFRLRIQHATGQLENVSRIRGTRRDIARIRTILHERSMAQVAGE